MPPKQMVVMLIEAAINGSRTKGEHPASPVTSSELASAAYEAVKAGAGALHFHARSEDGRETLDPAAVAHNLNIVRAKVRNVPIGISTGAWIVPDPAARLHQVRSWETLPDFASVNFHEEGALDLVATLLERGVGVEAGISNAHWARVFVSSGFGPKCLRVLVEPQEEATEAALKTVDEIETVLANGVELPTVLHGIGGTAWELLDASVRRGYSIRIGFEDTLRLRNGRTAQSNAELIREALAQIKALSSKRA
jgi:uncharacterized protein (DUF849 family)